MGSINNIKILKEERVETLDRRTVAVAMTEEDGEYYVKVHPTEDDGSILYDISMEYYHRTTRKSADLVLKFVVEIWSDSLISEKYDHAVEVSERSLSLINLETREIGKVARENSCRTPTPKEPRPTGINSTSSLRRSAKCRMQL